MYRFHFAHIFYSALRSSPLHNSTGFRLQTFQSAGMEGAMSRYKRIIGDTLRSHTRPAQEVETRIAVTVLNRMLDLGRPNSVRAA